MADFTREDGAKALIELHWQRFWRELEITGMEASVYDWLVCEAVRQGRNPLKVMPTHLIHGTTTADGVAVSPCGCSRNTIISAFQRLVECGAIYIDEIVKDPTVRVKPHRILEITINEDF